MKYTPRDNQLKIFSGNYVHAMFSKCQNLFFSNKDKKLGLRRVSKCGESKYEIYIWLGHFFHHVFDTFDK